MCDQKHYIRHCKHGDASVFYWLFNHVDNNWMRFAFLMLYSVAQHHCRSGDSWFVWTHSTSVFFLSLILDYMREKIVPNNGSTTLYRCLAGRVLIQVQIWAKKNHCHYHKRKQANQNNQCKREGDSGGRKSKFQEDTLR